MPFFPDDEDQNQLQGQKGQQPDGTVLSGEGTTFNDSGAPGGGAAQPGQTNQPTTSGRFTPIQKYLSANSGNAQTQLVDPLEKGWQGAQQGLQGADQQFKSEVDSKATRPDQAADQFAASNAAQVNADPNKKAAILGQRDASYTGPASLQETDYGNKAATAADQANQEIQSSKSEAGREGLIQAKTNRPTSTAGETKLDQLLMEQDPAARAKLLDLQNRFSGLGQQLGDTKTADQQYGTQAAKDAQTARQGFQDTVGKAYTDQKAAADKAYTDAVAAKQARDAALRGGFASNQLSGDDLSKYGLTDGMDTYGVKGADYIQNGQDPTRDSVLDKTTSANDAALAELTKNPWLIDQSKAGSYDPSQAVGFDASGYKNAIGTKDTAYNHDLDNTMVNTAMGAFDPDTGKSTGTTQESVRQALADLVTAKQKWGDAVPELGNPWWSKNANDAADAIRAKYNFGTLLKKA